MTDISEPTPVKKPVKKRKPQKAHSIKSAEPRNEYPGLTPTECASACSIKGCVISGESYCGHPCKGAMNPGGSAGVRRLQLAQKQLGIDAVNKRFA